MLTAEKKEMLKYFNIGLNAYKQRKWDTSIQAFEKALEFVPEDGPSKLYLDRSKEYQQNSPSEDWDGVFTMTEK